MDGRRINTHVPTLNANNCPYNWLYHFALPTDLSQYQYQHFLMYLWSVHMVNVTNMRWSSIRCQFQTSNIPLCLPDTIPMIWHNQHIDNIRISVISGHWHILEYLWPSLKLQFWHYSLSGYCQCMFQCPVFGDPCLTLQCFALYLILCLSFT